MKFASLAKAGIAFLLAFTLVASVMPASAAPTTISARINSCKQNVDSYSVMLQTGSTKPTASDVPTSVTLSFADGSTAQAERWAINIGSAYFRLDDSAGIYSEVPLVSATTQFDVAKYPSYRFTVTAHPCDPTPDPVSYTVAGVVNQKGNQKPVANLDVCVQELGICTTTDANGQFDFTEVVNGTYTITTNGVNWKSQSNTVVVDGADVYVNIVQSKGGGN